MSKQLDNLPIAADSNTTSLYPVLRLKKKPFPQHLLVYSMLQSHDLVISGLASLHLFFLVLRSPKLDTVLQI